MIRRPPRSTLFPYPPPFRPPPPSDPSTLKPPAARQGNGVACGGAMCPAGQKCGTDQTHGSFQPKCVAANARSEEHTSELQSHLNLVCRLLLEKKKKNYHTTD